MEIAEAYELINTCGLKTKAGYYNGSAMNESWFRKNGLDALYDLIMKETENFEGKLSQKLWAFENLPIPNCIECGKPAKKYDGANKWSDYCSAQCSRKSPNRAKKISATQLSRDSTESNEKRKKTMLEKYGYETNSQRPEIKPILSEKFSKAVIEPVEFDCSEYNKSLVEIQIKDFIQSFGFSVTSPTDKLSGKQEIDIFVEAKNLAIEVDGLYYHSYNQFESKDQKYRHLSKSIVASENGIDLVHITDSQWKNHRGIVESMIKSKLGLNKRIYARQCRIVELDVDSARDFIEATHLQGYAGSTFRYGLMNGDDLVACITFGKPRYDKTRDWELIRFSSALGITVVGGFSKLIKHFRKNHSGSIISYANRMHSNGNVYLRNGFTLIRETSPGYFWTDGDSVFSRTQFSKGLLHRKLKVFDDTLSEAENMFANKYRRFWDCGNLVFVI